MLKNSTFAWVAVVLLVIVSILLGSYRTFAPESEKVKNYFYYGDTGYSIQRNLDKKIEISYNYAKIAGKYIPGAKEVKAVETARENLLNAKGVEEKYYANAALKQAVEDLRAAIENIDMNEMDAGYRQSLYVDMQSRDNMIARDSYNGLAGEFNEKIKVFPGNMAVMAGLVNKAELFAPASND